MGNWLSNFYNCEFDELGYYTGPRSLDDAKEDPAFQTVKTKLLDARLDYATAEQQDRLTFSLCNPTAFKNRYLNLNCIDHNAHIVSCINKEIELLQKKDFPNLTDTERQHIVERVINHWRNVKSLNVKLFVSKIDGFDSSFVRWIVKKDIFDYGAFHVGLDIDGVILEWGQGLGGPSLVVPTVAVENSLVYARVNFDKIFPNEWMDQLKVALTNPEEFSRFGHATNDRLNKVSKRCVLYNTTYSYNLVNRNSQTFMKDILNDLQLQFNPQGEFKEFIDRVMTISVSDFIFKEEKFSTLLELENYADRYWDSLAEWDRRLLVCYADLMSHNYRHTQNSKWGPIDEEKWKTRISSL